MNEILPFYGSKRWQYGGRRQNSVSQTLTLLLEDSRRISPLENFLEEKRSYSKDINRALVSRYLSLSAVPGSFLNSYKRIVQAIF